jgi:hypothetical protein
MSEFWMAEQGIADRAKELIGKHHPEIATAEISYLFKDAASASEIESGQVCIAKKVTGIWKTLTNETDFVIILASDLWTELSTTQQTAMLDSALTSCTIKVDENGDQKIDKAGNPMWAIRPQDIVAHSSIIQRYGLEVLKDAGDCVRSFVDVKVVDTPDESEYDDGVADGNIPNGGTKKTRRSKAAS